MLTLEAIAIKLVILYLKAILVESLKNYYQIILIGNNAGLNLQKHIQQRSSSCNIKAVEPNAAYYTMM